MSRGLAALTGATGFLGVHLVRALHAQGFRVRALVRRPPSEPGWGGAAVERVKGSLFDDKALEQLVDGADVVVHAAGAIKADSVASYMAVNFDGVVRIAGAVERGAPGARFVLVSSLAAREPKLSAYAASKRAGETAAEELLPQGRLVIARPPAIYGPGDLETLTVFRAAAASPVLPVPSARGRLALVHVEDAAAQIAALAAEDFAGLYALADARPEGYRWREVLETACRAAGRRPLLAPAPAWAIPGFARAAEFIAWMNGRPPLLSSEKARELMHPDWSVSPQELAPGLPPPVYDLERGFSATLAWYRKAGWIGPSRSAT